VPPAASADLGWAAAYQSTGAHTVATIIWRSSSTQHSAHGGQSVTRGGGGGEAQP
jgi:hypothetical protein